MAEHNQQPDSLSQNIQDNVTRIKRIFLLPQNEDVALRRLHISSLDNAAVLIYVKPMVDAQKIEEFIITPLSSKAQKGSNEDIVEHVKSVMTNAENTTIDTMDKVTQDLNNGNTIILLDGVNKAISVSTTGFTHRAVESASDEKVIKGAKEAFTESASLNRSLIRKRIRDKNLVTEVIQVGKRSTNNVYIMYVSDLANEEILSTLKKRVHNIVADNVQSISFIEQYIEDRPKSIVPTILYTERPDRAVSYLEEGHIVLITENSPACLVAPATFWTLFHSSEDHNLKMAHGNFGRLIRMCAFFIALFTPSIYIAISTFHAEMLPPDLLLAIASTREKVPFPAVVEVIFMEIAFEILREAGVRIPNPIGPTIGIVGALILGQAAVEANLVSPIIVIVIALTGLSSFAISDVSVNYMLRMTRFIFTFSAALFGIFGVTVTFLVIYSYLVMVESFSVPYLSPMVPHGKSSGDTIFRRLLTKETLRPSNIKAKDPLRRNT